MKRISAQRALEKESLRQKEEQMEENLRRLVADSIKLPPLNHQQDDVAEELVHERFSFDETPNVCNEIVEILPNFEDELISSEDTEHGLKSDFLQDFMVLDKRNTVLHDNKRNLIVRDVNLVQTAQHQLPLSESIEMYWRAYKYFNSLVEPILDKETVERLLTVAACYKETDCVTELQKIVAKIPKNSYLILKSIIYHFARLGTMSDARSLFSLGTVFGSALFRTKNFNPQLRVRSRLPDGDNNSFTSLENHLGLTINDSFSELSEECPEAVIPGYRKPREEEADQDNRIDDDFYKKLIISNTSLTQRKSVIYESGKHKNLSGSAKKEFVYELDSKFLSKLEMSRQLFQSLLCNAISDECISMLVRNCDKIFIYNTHSK